MEMFRLAPVILSALIVVACQYEAGGPKSQWAGDSGPRDQVAEMAFKVAGNLSGAETQIVPDFARRAPQKIVVFPFDWQADSVDPEHRREAVREVTQTFRNVFSSLQYIDVKIAAMEDAMLRAGLAPGDAVPAEKRKSIAADVGADAMIVGNITAYDKVYAGIYGQLAAGIDVSMIALSDDLRLWRAHHVVRKHHGGIPLSPMEAVTTLIGTAMEVTDKARVAALDELMRDVVVSVPRAGRGIRGQETRILAARHSGSDKPLKAGDEIRLAVSVSRDTQVKAQIGKTINVPLARAQGGGEQGILFEGRYRFKAGDDMSKEMVLFIAYDETGRSVDYVDPYAPLTVDTIPPDLPTNLRARLVDGKMKLSWSGSKAKDVASYEILRSGTPRTGYVKIGETEFEVFVDDRPPAPAFYQVVARDRAGNVAEPTAFAEGRRVASGPTYVRSNIDLDTTWFAESSPYIIDRPLLVAKGATLIVDPGTTVRANAGTALTVDGRILAEGTAQQPITWEGPESGRWQGVTIRNAGLGDGQDSVITFNRFTGAEIALAISAASPTVIESTFSRSNIGIRIAEAASEPKLHANQIRNNRIGVLLEAADVNLSGQVIRFNSEFGIEINGAMPHVSENDLSNNAQGAIRVRDQTKHGIFEAGKNWWGTTDPQTVRSMIMGPVAFEPLLDAAPPGGKPLMDTRRTILALPGITTPNQARPRSPQGKAGNNEGNASGGRGPQKIQMAFSAMEEGRTDEALAILREIAPRAERNPLVHYRLALLEFQKGSLQAAKEAVEKAISINPGAYQFHMSHAMILKNLGDEIGSAEAFRKAKELNPSAKIARKPANNG